MITSFLKIDSVNMPEPGTFHVEGTDLDAESTKRLENGNMHRSIIGFGWRTPSCKWNAIPQAEAQLLLSSIKKKSFTATYYDPELGVVTKTCYAGPWSADYVAKTHGQPGGPYWNITMDVIESNR